MTGFSLNILRRISLLLLKQIYGVVFLFYEIKLFLSVIHFHKYID